MPNDRREHNATKRGVAGWSIHVKRRKAPNVAHSTLGVQNSQDQSSMGVSITVPGMPA